MARVTNHLDEFFTMARAHERRIHTGELSGDRVLDGLPPISLVGGCRLLRILDDYPDLRAAATIVTIDWWTSGALSEPGSVVWARVQRWLADGADLAPKLENLVRLASMGLVGISGDAPARRIGWSSGAALIDKLVGAESLAQVDAAATATIGPTGAQNVVRLLRGRVHDTEVPWVTVTGTAGAAIGWALRSAPHYLHPVKYRQPVARLEVQTLLGHATPERWPGDDFPAWTPDSLVAWCELVWAYLKARWPHLKDPVA